MSADNGLPNLPKEDMTLHLLPGEPIQSRKRYTANQMTAYGIHCVDADRVTRPAVVSEGQAVAWMWKRNIRGGGYTYELCTSRQKAEELAEDGKGLPWPDLVIPLYDRHAEPAPEAPIYVPIAVHQNDMAHGRHPKDDTLADAACQAALNARGDDSGQGLDSYWKWGFRAGWAAHEASEAPTAAQAPEVVQTPQEWISQLRRFDIEQNAYKAHMQESPLKAYDGSWCDYDEVCDIIVKLCETAQPKAAPVAEAPTEPSTLEVITKVQQHLVDTIRAFGDINCAAYISTWHKPAEIAKNLGLAAPATEQAKESNNG